MIEYEAEDIEKSKEVYSVIEQFFGKEGLKKPIRLNSIYHGRNNRVFKIDSGSGVFLLKSYFHEQNDPQNRLQSEFAFTSFAWKNGIRAIPKPIAYDHFHSFGLYEFLIGKKLNPGEVGWQHVDQALDFLRSLNRLKDKPGARELPDASEAFFSIFEHIHCVDNRLNKLKRIEVSDVLKKKAIHFIADELFPVWKLEKAKLLKLADELNVHLDHHISTEDRCLSPSDFGFHNAILLKDGSFRFIDFEYAGWDDPAKTVCDFFCQPEIPVPIKYFPLFEASVLEMSPDPKKLAQRIKLLFPVYKIKWCCIILNDFLPVGNKRRQFAQKRDCMERKKYQLAKAESYLHQFLMTNN
jgi:hypothetical protein